MPGFPAVKLAVAFSGGVDSTALLLALTGLPRHPMLRLRALHVDHGLHVASPRWSAHCRALALGLRVPFATYSVSVPVRSGESPEAAARAARYARLRSAVRPQEYLLTAHHGDDQLETVLLQLFRGAGLPGLAAMPAMMPFGRGFLARPMLDCRRDELAAWVQARGVEWVEDPANVDDRFDRSFLRRHIVPALRSRWPGLGATVARAAAYAAEGQALLGDVARRDIERAAAGDGLSAKALRALPLSRRRNALRFWIAARGIRMPDARRLEEMAGPLLAARPDSHPLVGWNGWAVRRVADVLVLGARDERELPPICLNWAWREQACIELPGGWGRLSIERAPRGPLDLDALPPALTIRARCGGERLRLHRHGPRRSLKNLLQEAHVPVAERAALPLVFAGEALVCVGARWLDVSVQASTATAHRGRIRLRPVGRVADAIGGPMW